MWDREGAEKEERNTIVHSFNRNFSSVLMETKHDGFRRFARISDRYG
jgi:hypothetical protein